MHCRIAAVFRKISNADQVGGGGNVLLLQSQGVSLQSINSGDHIARPGDGRNAAITGFDEVLGDFLGAGDVIHVNIADARIGGMTTHEDKGHMAGDQRLQQRIVQQHRRQNHAIDQAVVQNLGNHAAFVIRLGEPEHDRVVVRVTRRRDALNENGKVGIAE